MDVVALGDRRAQLGTQNSVPPHSLASRPITRLPLRCSTCMISYIPYGSKPARIS